jgi:hypothetical protein
MGAGLEPMTREMREEFLRLSASSPILRWMLDDDIELTRANYLALAYDEMPEECGAEQELELPAPFRLTEG